MQGKNRTCVRTCNWFRVLFTNTRQAPIEVGRVAVQNHLTACSTWDDSAATLTHASRRSIA